MSYQRGDVDNDASVARYSGFRRRDAIQILCVLVHQGGRMTSNGAEVELGQPGTQER
jgi:hypothetical protein